MKFIVHFCALCLVLLSEAYEEDEAIARVSEKPVEYLAQLLAEDISVVFMGSAGDSYLFESFTQSRRDGDILIGSVRGRFRCRGVRLTANIQTDRPLTSFTMCRVARVDASDGSIVLDIDSFQKAIEKALKETETRMGEPSATDNPGDAQ